MIDCRALGELLKRVLFTQDWPAQKATSEREASFGSNLSGNGFYDFSTA